MNILKIILWPVDMSKEVRIIDFEATKVNVIRGDSRTGKSALIPIIDYVLGSTKCKIPVDVIRNTVDWFGILLNDVSNEILLARKSPGTGNSKTAFYYEIDKTISIPKTIIKENMNLEMMKNLFNEYFNYTDLVLNEGVGFANRPSFRDSVSMNFQPQTIIASPNVLYFKADSNDHREKLKNFLPYVLDIVTNQNLLDFHKIEMLEKENKKLDKLRYDQEEYMKGYDRRLNDLIVESISLGLIDDTDLMSVDCTEKRISIIKKAYISEKVIFTADSLNKYNELIDEKEKSFSKLHEDILKLNNQCKSIQQQIDQFGEADFIDQNAITERVSLADWLICKIDDFTGLETVSIENIKRSINNYKQLNDEIIQAISIMKSELVIKKQSLKVKQSEFNSMRTELHELYKSQTNSDKRNLYERIAEFKGRLNYEIKFFDNLKNDDIKSKIMKNELELKRLRYQTNYNRIKDKKKEVLNELTNKIRYYLKGLDVDDCISPVQLDLTELTLFREKKESSDYQGKEYLWEIGSASNWLSYHIATFLAIHDYLNEIPNRKKVFNLIVFDQPSQVYFPDNMKEDKKKNIILDKDLENVKKVFNALSIFINNNKNYQIIVLEHAPESIWRNFNNICTKEVWDENTNDKLIPESWYSK